MIRIWRSLLGVGLFVTAGVGTGWAQSSDGPPVRIIVPFAAGGGADTSVRGFAPALGQALGRTVVVENVTGGSGSLAVARTMQSKPDGSTLIYVNGVIAANAAARPAANIDLNRDLAPVGQIGQSVFALTAAPTLGVKTVHELIALGKKTPGGLRFGSVGPGSNHHFVAEMFRSATKLEMSHIPYRGEALAIPDLIAGRIDMMFLTAAVGPYIETGKLTGLGVMSADTWFSLPQLPPLSKVGFPSLVYNGWGALMAPKDTPPALLAKLNTALGVALKSEAAMRTSEKIGLKVFGGSPEDLVRHIDEDMALYRRLIREGNLKFD